MVDPRARIMGDENSAYRGSGNEFDGGHEAVTHGAKEYARRDVNTNTTESSFALVKAASSGRITTSARSTYIVISGSLILVGIAGR